MNETANAKVQSPHDIEAEENLLKFLEKQQSKKQSIQSFIDYIPEGLFYAEEHQTKYEEILNAHKQDRRKEIPKQQSYWVSDLMDLKKKRDLLNLLNECQVKIYDNKQSFKIISGRLLAQIDAI